LLAPSRRFVGQRPLAPARESGLDVLADLLLSETGAEAPARGRVSPAPARPLAPAGAPRGLYALVPAGIEPAERRRVGLAVARRLAPSSRPAAVFVFEKDRADAHLLGEPACGRMGPQNYLQSSDVPHAVADLVGQCDQVGIVLLHPPNGLWAGLRRAVRAAVFVAAPDTESLVETYREVKGWRTQGAEAAIGLFVVGSESGAEVAGIHRRLSEAARQFLGCQVDPQGFMGAGAAAAQVEPLSVLAQVPIDDVWPRILSALRVQPPAAGDALAPDRAPAAPERFAVPSARAQGPAPGTPPARVPPRLPDREPAPTDFPAFSLWQPEERGELVAAVEVQVPALMGEHLRMLFRVDVSEPDAPPLAAVRDDGALVAILLNERAGPSDTQAAERWLEVHRSLLARAYPAAGISARPPAAIVLAPLAPAPAGDGMRRFIPVRAGARRGIVLLP
jgi:hypothetical protein